MLENILLSALIREVVDVVKKIIKKRFGRRKEKRNEQPLGEKEPVESPGTPALTPPALPQRQQPGVHFVGREKELALLEKSLAKKGGKVKTITGRLFNFAGAGAAGFPAASHRAAKYRRAVERLFPGDRWALRTAYGHRALILQDWGKLAEALALLKKQESICEELGDRAGLAICWGNQGLIYGKQGDRAEQIELRQKSIAANKAMGIPTGELEKEVKKLRR